MTTIKNWDGKAYTLDELLLLVDTSSELEMSFDEAVDMDLATSPTIIKNLILHIKQLEVQQ